MGAVATPQLIRSSAMFIIGWVVSGKIIIVFIGGDTPCAPIGL